MKIVMYGFLDYKAREKGWEDSIRLLDEGPPGEMGYMPLVMDRAKLFHGKEVRITIETLTAPPEAVPAPEAVESPADGSPNP